MNTGLIIGASRGLGLGLAEEYLKRGWCVIATMRGNARTGLNDLADRHGDDLEIEQLDINRPDQLAALRARLEGRRLDLLFVNAGVTNDPGETIADVSAEEFTRIMVTNALSPMRTVEALQHLVPATGAIAVMTSGLGSVADNESGGWEIYRASKASLNTLMRSFAARHSADPRALFVMHPGWVRTDMGGPHADLSVSESISGVVDVIANYTGQPGLRFLDYRGRIVRW
ncbi:MAG TPA: SDR family NAD(P)-dependent oxidoreductase [Rhizomicrobium sp.]|jgi:NAD(P)-dependent dehydrogenase (short-subunit alcohol dehydrogenase family)|nr:SDR family NAD(P)-dependent oxidoreductase [Rhizomicrobium sp.]